MADLDINFRSTHEGDGGRKTQEEIDAVKESSRQASEAVKEQNQAHTANARALNESAHATETQGAALDTMALKAAAAAAVIAALTAAVKNAVAGFAEKEELVTALDAALAQHGNLVDSVREQYQGLANQLQET